MRILIATGIYPPRIGGPAQYAKNLKEAFSVLGHHVSVVTYTEVERTLPIGLRHLYFFFKILPHVLVADYIIALDTMSVGFPTVCASRMLRKMCVIRTGGDFLWESYTERTGDLVLLRNFYRTSLSKLSSKEKLIFRLTRFTLRHASRVVFSTTWQRDIWRAPYGVADMKTMIIENYYGDKVSSSPHTKRNFIMSTRPLKWKNSERVKKAFLNVQSIHKDIVADESTVPYHSFVNKLSNCYALLLVSLGDISPNTVMDTLSLSKPVILTKENGITERVKDFVYLVDPENEEEIQKAISDFCDPLIYDEYKKKAEQFNFVHSWQNIAREFLALYKKS